MPKLVANWRLAHKFWTVRLAVFWAIVSGLWVALPAFQNWMHPLVFAALCVAFSLAILFARVTHQSDIPE